MSNGNNETVLIKPNGTVKLGATLVLGVVTTLLAGAISWGFISMVSLPSTIAASETRQRKEAEAIAILVKEDLRREVILRLDTNEADHKAIREKLNSMATIDSVNALNIAILKLEGAVRDLKIYQK